MFTAAKTRLSKSPFKRTYSLRDRLLLGLTILALILLSLIYVLSNNLKTHFLETAVENAFNLLDTTAADYRSLIISTEQLLEAVAHVPAAYTFQPTCESVLKQIIKESPTYTGLFVMRPNGMSPCSSLGTADPPNNSERTYFKKAVSSGQFVLGDYQIGARSGKPVVIAALPKYNAANNLKAVIAVGIDLTFLSNTESRVQSGENSSFFLLDASGNIIVGNRGMGEKFAIEAVNEAMAETSRGFVETMGPDNQTYLFMFTPLIADEAHRVILAIPKADILAPISRPFNVMIIAVVIGSILTLVLLGLAANYSFLSPLENLNKTANAVRAGNLNARIGPPYATNELGELSLNFDHMAQALKVRQEENETIQAQLQEKAEQLSRSNQELEQFAYVASHDLQEPLRMVTSYLQLIEHRYSDVLDDKGKQFIEFAVDGAKRMKLLTNDLLTLSRVTTQGVSLTPDVDVEKVLSQAISNVQVSIKQQQAIITHDALPKVMGDKNQLVQLFQNLLSNALKFHSDVPPKIHVSSVQEGRYWHFCVEDNGIGIEPEYRERIFTIFQRLHPRSEYEGTGIGLSICQKIVARHEGKIWVQSNMSGGSTFCFTLLASEDS